MPLWFVLLCVGMGLLALVWLYRAEQAARWKQRQLEHWMRHRTTDDEARDRAIFETVKREQGMR